MAVVTRLVVGEGRADGAGAVVQAGPAAVVADDGGDADLARQLEPVVVDPHRWCWGRAVAGEPLARGVAGPRGDLHEHAATALGHGPGTHLDLRSAIGPTRSAASTTTPFGITESDPSPIGAPSNHPVMFDIPKKPWRTGPGETLALRRRFVRLQRTTKAWPLGGYTDLNLASLTRSDAGVLR